MDKFTSGLPLIFFVFMFEKCFKLLYFRLIFSNKYTDFKKRLREKTKRLPKNSKGKTATEWVYRQSEKRRRRWALPAPAPHPSPTCHQPLQYMEIGPPTIRHPLLPDMQIKVPSDPLSSLSSALPNALPSSCCCFYSCSAASMLAFSNLSKTPFIDSSCIINVVNDHSTSVAKKKKTKGKEIQKTVGAFWISSFL